MMTGGCLCGGVRYEVGGPQLFGGFCYCIDCRKTSGGHSASMAVPEASVKITGETRSYVGKGDSGNPVERVFCPNCGSAILSRGARPGVVMLKANTLDDPEQFKPMAAIYVSRAASWDGPPAGMPAFPEMPPQS
ncbi:MAG: GFA family protein [Hyphomonadaceae bacterium]